MNPDEEFGTTAEERAEAYRRMHGEVCDLLTDARAERERYWQALVDIAGLENWQDGPTPQGIAQSALSPPQIMEVVDAVCRSEFCTSTDTYCLEARCQNCKWEGAIRLTVEHEPSREDKCPRCHCNRLSTSGWIEDPIKSEAHFGSGE